jgi:hypothetical protein
MSLLQLGALLALMQILGEPMRTLTPFPRPRNAHRPIRQFWEHYSEAHCCNNSGTILQAMSLANFGHTVVVGLCA